jgi:molecular chaperone GrpE
LLAREERDTFGDKESDRAEAHGEESLEQLLGQEKEKAERYLANWQRTEADFRNYKAREEQEKKDLINWANSTLVCDILPALDAFDRAFEGINLQGNDISWIAGFKQIQKMLLDTLSKHGVSEVKCVGEIFDPSRHEAVVQQNGTEGLILGEVRKGYVMKEKLIRAPQVVVGKGAEKPNTDPTGPIDGKISETEA